MILLISTKETSKETPVTRFRISELTLKRACRRHRLTPEFTQELQEWLLDAGWALFWAGNTFAMIRTAMVDGWVRLASKRIEADLVAVSRGEYDFAPLFNSFEQAPASQDSKELDSLDASETA